MRAFLRTGARAAAAAVVAAAAFYGVSTAEAAPVGASAGTHIADVAKAGSGVEQVHRRWHRRYWGGPYGYYRPYRPYYYGYPYRRYYYGGGYPYYGGYGWRRRPGIYFGFGF